MRKRIPRPSVFVISTGCGVSTPCLLCSHPLPSTGGKVATLGWGLTLPGSLVSGGSIQMVAAAGQGSLLPTRGSPGCPPRPQPPSRGSRHTRPTRHSDHHDGALGKAAQSRTGSGVRSSPFTPTSLYIMSLVTRYYYEHFFSDLLRHNII